MIKIFLFNIISWLNFNKNSKIIFYHDVHATTRYTPMSTPLELFKQHLQIAQNKFKLVKTISREKGEIQICFDDGFRGIYATRDFFAEQKIYPTVFLAITLIGQEGYLTKPEIIELQQLGFRFQSHAWSHHNLTLFSDSDLKFELEESKKQLEEMLNTRVDEICFPIGYYSARVLQACRVAGYKKMYSSLPGNYFNKRNDGLLYRNLVQFSSPAEFKAILYGGMSPLRCWYKSKHFIKNDQHVTSNQ